MAETRDGVVLAQCSGVIWSPNAKAIRAQLKDDYLNVLKQGNEVLIEVEVSFDIRYGLKIVVRDLDLGFLLGEIEKRKQENLHRLKKEGVFDANKSLNLPLVLQRIALIASSRTAGYEDFMQQLEANALGYRFDIHHFPSSVQGDQAMEEVLAQLRASGQEDFDAVVLIRGGGSKMDLDVFNAYEIGLGITACRHPVLTGIGHETDTSIADLVAHRAFKTPTAVASFILDRARGFEEGIQTDFQSVLDLSGRLLNNQRSEFTRVSEGLAHQAVQSTRLKRGDLHNLMHRVVQQTLSRISGARSILRQDMHSAGELAVNRLETRVQALRNQKEMLVLLLHRMYNHARNTLERQSGQIPLYSPRAVLGRGYVIPRYRGQLYRGLVLPPGERIELEFKDRKVQVEYLKESKDEER